MFLLTYVVISVFALLSGYTANGYEYEFPEGCKNDLFCDVKPYFYDNIQEDLDEKISVIKEKFNFNFYDEYQIEEDSVDAYTGQNCAHQTTFTTPYMVNVSNTIKLVAQTNLLKQTIKQTKCAYDVMESKPSSSQCFADVSNTITGTCKTKDSTISLYLYDAGKKQVQRYPVNVPVCCHCVINQ